MTNSLTKSNPFHSLLALIFIFILIFGISFFTLPGLPDFPPLKLTVEELLKEPEQFSQTYVAFENAYALNCNFFLGRSIYEISCKQCKSTVWVLSNSYYRDGQILKDRVYYVKLIGGTGDSGCVVMLKEVRN